MTQDEAKQIFSAIVRTVLDTAQDYRISTGHAPDTILVSSEAFDLAIAATDILRPTDTGAPSNAMMIGGYLLAASPALTGAQSSAIGIEHVGRTMPGHASIN